MLQSLNYKKDDIVSFKLVNGDEIIAKIIEETDKEFIVAKPCTVMPSQQGIGLIQSLFTSDLNKNVPLEKRHVMLHSATIDAIKNHYIQTTTGIEPVTTGGIIT
jgi:hypothetical protein